MWKKRKDIEGVSEGSLVGLKAVLFQKEQEAKKFKATGEQRPRVRKKPKETVWTRQNKGLEERSRRDQVAVAQDVKSIEQSEAKLKEKAKIYESFVSGGLADDHENGKYLVDFERKSWDVPQIDTSSDTELYSKDMEQEEERRKWERRAQREMEDESLTETKKNEELAILDQLIQQTKEGRQRHQQLKEKRKQKAKERLQKIKQREATWLQNKQEGEQQLPQQQQQEEEEEQEEEETLTVKLREEEEEDDIRPSNKASELLSVDMFLASIRNQQQQQQG